MKHSLRLNSVFKRSVFSEKKIFRPGSKVKLLNPSLTVGEPLLESEICVDFFVNLVQKIFWRFFLFSKNRRTTTLD